MHKAWRFASVPRYVKTTNTSKPDKNHGTQTYKRSHLRARGRVPLMPQVIEVAAF
jgi:hypothetical protein